MVSRYNSLIRYKPVPQEFSSLIINKHKKNILLHIADKFKKSFYPANASKGTFDRSTNLDKFSKRVKRA